MVASEIATRTKKIAMTHQNPVPTWKKVLAAILDFLTIFLVGGFVIAWLTSGQTDGGFNLEGVPAVILFVLVIAYFVIGHRYAGGTIWQRILKTRG
jgi:DMSO reductase anchor subunit